MGVKIVQDIIDAIRVKRDVKFQVSSAFTDRVKLLIKQSAPYYYPENKGLDIQGYNDKVEVCTNPVYNYYKYKTMFNKLKKLGIKELEYTYNNLNDEYSKEIFLMVLVYNLFDRVKLRFPWYYSRNIIDGKMFNQMLVDDTNISIWNDYIKLKKYNLASIGYNLEVLLNNAGIQIDFIDEQYAYKDLVSVQSGDNVIDAGACYGDTALYFANKNNNQGKVYSFEFLPENVDIFNKNMELNPQYKDNIELIQRPISDVSGNKLYAVPNGPGTSITTHQQENAIELQTISIDDFVEQNNIEKIDFIKMDIEGSEEAALRGAIKTIKKHKPKLAICAYHKKDDLVVLPKLIKEMIPEYKLYLDHYTANTTETVLYAKV